MGVLREAAALLKPAAKGAVFGVVVYFAADMGSDIYTFFQVRQQALERVAASPDVAALVGEPCSAGPWYNGTLGFSHRDRVAHVTFQLVGAARTTDVVARAARRPGPRLNMWYNAFGPGAWDLVTCQAMFPGEGGLAAPRNLMPPLPAVEKSAGQGGGGKAEECLPCKQQQQQQQKQQQTSQQQRQPGGRWWWPFSSRSSSGPDAQGSSSGSSSSSSSERGSGSPAT